MTEEWKKIYKAEEYEVSSLGRIRKSGKIFEPQKPSKRGYFMVDLRRTELGKNIPVHRIVASAFIPNPKGKPHVDHINNNKQDNRIDNLQWLTSRENTQKYFRSIEARRSTGENHYHAHFKNDQVIDYRIRYDLGESIISLATEAGCDQETMRGLIRRKTYKNI